MARTSRREPRPAGGRRHFHHAPQSCLPTRQAIGALASAGARGDIFVLSFDDTWA
ncbi:hypothetical protein ACIBBB_36095 [Streptomyces sp. NPDC051217]|uniref:hypothetical protein n=1 Tax=Streptomyces sp. NPDC051217 TaxID=3365644 RepID=UPI0037A54ADF